MSRPVSRGSTSCRTHRRWGSGESRASCRKAGSGGGEDQPRLCDETTMRGVARLRTPSPREQLRLDLSRTQPKLTQAPKDEILAATLTPPPTDPRSECIRHRPASGRCSR
jgi:hypothetical protein